MSDWSGTRVLVLGASGFIGRYVALALHRAGALVSIGARSPGSARPDFPLNADQVVAIDATRPETIAAGIARSRPAVVFNLAGYGVNPAERDEGLATAINTEFPAAIVEAMRAPFADGWRGQQVVHTGSALEYGTAAGDLNERTVCTPTTQYGRTKLEGTRRLADRAAGLGVLAMTARLFTVYGPGERTGRLLPTLLGAARTSDAVPLTAGGQLRDFTYLGDVADGLMRLAVLDSAVGVVNLATGQLTTVRGFVEAAADVLGIERSRLHFGEIPTRPEEMRHDPVSIARLKSLTGWTPATTIRDGVARTATAPSPPAPRSPSA